MIVLIPLGGIGSRYRKNGFTRPKALVKVFGKPILFWLLDSLKVDENTIIYIPYNREYLRYQFEDLLYKNFPTLQFRFLVLDRETKGAAETLHIALSNLDIVDQPVISLDSDNFYLSDIISLWNKKNSLLVFNDTNPQPLYSYVKTDSAGKITDIVEKQKISDIALWWICI